MCGVERVFVSSIIERGKTHKSAKVSVKQFNSIRKCVNEKLKKHFKRDYVDTAKRLIYPRHYEKDFFLLLLKLRHVILSKFAKTIPKSVVMRK